MSNISDSSRAAQTTHVLLMIRPAHFGPNPETAASNAFQQDTDCSPAVLERISLAEFDGMVSSLRRAGVRVLVIDDTDQPCKRDAVFPNNWFTTHATGDIFLFPLEAPGRRAERRMDIIDSLSAEHGFAVRRVVDLSAHEAEGRYLEGSGSMVLDRANRIIFATCSTRTHTELLNAFAHEVGYEVCVFDTLDSSGRAIYHTNVMLAIGEKFVVVCAAAINDARQRAAVMECLTRTGRGVIEITMEQMTAFAGNMLGVRTAAGESLIILSTTARDALTSEQRATLQRGARLLPVAVDTIERIGGGSVRCMLAEIFLPCASTQD